MAHQPRYPIESGPAYFQRWDKYDPDDDLRQLEAADPAPGGHSPALVTPGPAPAPDGAPPPGTAVEDVLLAVSRKHRIDPELLLACQQALRLKPADVEALTSGEQMKAHAIRSSAAFERERQIVRELELQQFIAEQCGRSLAAKAQQSPAGPAAAADPVDALAATLGVTAQRLRVCANALRLTPADMALLPEGSRANLQLVRCDPAFATLRTACRRLGLAPTEEAGPAAVADVEELLRQLASEGPLPLEAVRAALRCLHLSEAEAAALAPEADRAAASLFRSDPGFSDFRRKARSLGLLPEGTVSTAPILAALAAVDSRPARALAASLQSMRAGEEGRSPAATPSAAPVEPPADLSEPAGRRGGGEVAPVLSQPLSLPPTATSSDVVATPPVSDFRTPPAYHTSGTDQCLTVTVELPLLVDMSSVSLSVEERQLLLTTPTEYHLVVPLPVDMSGHTVQAKFHKKQRRLTITLSET